jgi:hypothetical protein
MVAQNDQTKLNMKKIFTFLVMTFLVNLVSAQITEKEPDNKSVPQSSAFKLVDISPTLIETPTTPKAFGLGIMQNFDKSASWPQNYAAEFTPYWWSLPKNRNVYKFLGIRRIKDPITNADIYRSSPFSALKMTNISIAFLQKDLVPDNEEITQKVFSVGMRTTIIRLYSTTHNEILNKTINDVRDFQAKRITQQVSDLDIIAAGNDLVKIEAAIKEFAEKTREEVEKLMQPIQDHIAQKPLFQWDLAAAYAMYGISDTIWKTGRVGVWSTLSLNHLLNAHGESSKQNYFTLSVYSRLMNDNYSLENGVITNSNSYDLGGRLSFEFDPISIGFEAVDRNYKVEDDLKSQRIVGFLNYRIGKDIYLNGAFGNDFGIDKSKIMALFGINWGFGTEKLSFSN